MEVRKSLAALPGEVSVNGGEVARVQLGSDGWERYAGVGEETQASLRQEVWARGGERAMMNTRDRKGHGEVLSF